MKNKIISDIFLYKKIFRIAKMIKDVEENHKKKCDEIVVLGERIKKDPQDKKAINRLRRAARVFSRHDKYLKSLKFSHRRAYLQMMSCEENYHKQKGN